MRVEDLLRERRTAIVSRWLQLTVKTYPESAARFLEEGSDRFQNPVGSTLAREIPFLYDALLRPPDREAVASHLDPIVRIRAVQDFSPAEAVGFVLLLKQAIREELAPELRKNGSAVEWPAIESRIDDLVLQAFDVYVHCRAQIYELRIDEIKRQLSRRLERAIRGD